MGLLDLKPHEVSRDLRGYSVLLFGTPKSGKTTTASKFPDALLLAFEKGYNALPGVYAQPINSWGEFKKILTELKDPEVQEKFSTIVIDTADIAYNYCEKFICSREGVETIGDIAYGRGYTLVGNEFDEAIRKVLQLNYGLVLISHATDKTFKDADGVEFNQIVPTLDKRGRLICERTCDIIGYSTIVNTEDGPERRLYLRESPRYMAGSRFRYTPEYINFTYDALVKAIADAIEAEAKENNGQFVTNERNQVIDETIEYDYKKLKATFQDLVGKLMTANQSNAAKITVIVEKHLGRQKKVTDCTEEQCEQIDMINHDLERLLAEL